MAVIQRSKELKMENVLSLRKKMTQEQMQKEMAKIGQFFEANAIKKAGNITTTTYYVDSDGTLDMEILVPMDKLVELPSEYRLKPVFKLVNAVYARHEGNPSNLQNVYNEMLGYIKENNLQQITTGYNVTVKDITPNMSMDEVVIDVYIGVSENVL
ncbi:AraC family transcriptional regulator [Herbivorax sp. ANBcel31]|uniref:GyrI-like domain-containing protein n=1 Tax=Herbivorax sp. ANBcel31 TaxID=3069754 RepID=UPI0027AE807C|nr:GyrI-like domain-containing protein [Herbivorax sp. ANBcel31]MDQ2085163.1 AraC family transcriptional regulator [Herbivorax sp. ANBcel31]